jgi:hypothetical protein
MADSTPTEPPTHSPPECPACRIVATLAAHRDDSHPDWSIRRGVLNFAILIAQRECPAHRYAWSEAGE